MTIVEPSQVPKERPVPKLSLPQTKVTFQPTTPVPPTQHRKMLVVSEHQRNVMTSLASLWKKGQLCDAGIGNGTTIVMVSFCYLEMLLTCQQQWGLHIHGVLY